MSTNMECQVDKNTIEYYYPSYIKIAEYWLSLGLYIILGVHTVQNSVVRPFVELVIAACLS